MGKQKPRWISIKQATERGLTLREIHVLQEALYLFDDSYNDLLDHLKKLGATPIVYRIVNGTIKSVMGRTRGQVDLWSVEEMTLWGWGYNATRENLTDLIDPAQDARDGFEQAQRVMVQIQYDDGGLDEFYADVH